MQNGDMSNSLDWLLFEAVNVGAERAVERVTTYENRGLLWAEVRHTYPAPLTHGWHLQQVPDGR